MGKKKNKYSNSNKPKFKNMIYLIPIILIVLATPIFFGWINFMSMVQVEFQTSGINNDDPNILYFVNMSFASEGSIIAGKPVDVEIEALYVDNSAAVKEPSWNKVSISIGGQQCYLYKEKDRMKYKEIKLIGKPKKMIELQKNGKYPAYFKGKTKVIFEQPGTQPIYEILFVNDKLKLNNWNNVTQKYNHTINVQDRSVWLSVVQNRIGLSLTIIAIAFTIFQVTKEIFGS